MTPELIAAILGMVVKYGPELTVNLINDLKGGKTIDDAIAALQKAQAKTAQDYLTEAKASLSPVPPTK